MLSDAKPLFNNQFSFKSSLVRCQSSEESTILEDSYDFREKYPKCVNKIYNQGTISSIYCILTYTRIGNCSSSYAIAATSALSDRVCMQTSKNVNLSPQTYLSCDPQSKNCEGGAVASVLDAAKKDGVVSESCLAYNGEQNTTCPDSVKQCQKYYALDYCVSSTAEGIKREILKNGPVVGVIPVYRDFLVYKEGVYYVVEGTSRFQGAQALKVVGWGKTPEGKEYWIAENSWDDSWGIKGYANIAIGEKNLYLDEFVLSPTPKVETEASSTTSTGSKGNN